jgi:hypothetical protein
MLRRQEGELSLTIDARCQSSCARRRTLHATPASSHHTGLGAFCTPVFGPRVAPGPARAPGRRAPIPQGRTWRWTGTAASLQNGGCAPTPPGGRRQGCPRSRGAWSSWAPLRATCGGCRAAHGLRGSLGQRGHHDPQGGWAMIRAVQQAGQRRGRSACGRGLPVRKVAKDRSGPLAVRARSRSPTPCVRPGHRHR